MTTMPAASKIFQSIAVSSILLCLTHESRSVWSLQIRSLQRNLIRPWHCTILNQRRYQRKQRQRLPASHYTSSFPSYDDGSLSSPSSLAWHLPTALMMQTESSTSATPTSSSTTATTSDTDKSRATKSVSSSSSSSSSSSRTKRNKKSLPSSDYQPSHLQFLHPRTNTTIILLGCIHGTTSSAQDVRHHLHHSTHKTHVVVLELCAERFTAIQRTIIARTSPAPNDPTRPPPSSGGGIADFVAMVAGTVRERGWSTGIAAGVLGGVSRVQTALSRFDPGLEFVTAIEYVMERRGAGGRGDGGSGSVAVADDRRGRCDLVLADQAVDETLRRVGSLPLESWEMWLDYCGGGGGGRGRLGRGDSSILGEGRDRFNWKQSYGTVSKYLSSAIWGDDEWVLDVTKRKLELQMQTAPLDFNDDTDNEQVEEETRLQLDMGKAVVRDKDVVIDLLRSTLPSLLLIQLITTVINTSLNQLYNGGGNDLAILSTKAMFDLTSSMSIDDFMKIGVDLSLDILTSGLVLFIGHIVVVLPMVRIILTERDDQLARGIDVACEIAAETAARDEDKSVQGSGGRVVAVLGLLHLNGVARRLIEGAE